MSINSLCNRDLPHRPTGIEIAVFKVIRVRRCDAVFTVLILNLVQIAALVKLAKPSVCFIV